MLQLIEVTALRQQANRLGLKDVNLLGAMAKLSPVDLGEKDLVELTHKLKGVRYLQSSKLLSVPVPISSGTEPKSDDEVIDWLWQLFAIVFGAKNGKAEVTN